MNATPVFGEKPEDRSTRAAKIRALFHGGTIESHTDICFRAQIWTEAENAAAAMAHHRHEVREALRALIDGIPWAGDTGERSEDGKPVWKQESLWEYEHYEFHITSRLTQAGGDIAVINKLIERCWGRFGRAPMKRVELIEVQDEPDAA